jgi:hypothetical protein
MRVEHVVRKSSGSGRRLSGKAAAELKARRRNVIVLTGLVGMLTLTSAVLMALAPAPLTPGAASSLFAVDEQHSLDSIFQTRTPVLDARGNAFPGRWNYIYIHHSRTLAGDALTVGPQSSVLGVSDHFVIGNGDGAGDGEIQVGQRWNQQLPPAAPLQGATIDPAFISVCLVGDFDQTVPTPTQIKRLSQLVSTLQSRLGISRDAVVLLNDQPSAAGIGKYFPVSAFKEQISP